MRIASYNIQSGGFTDYGVKEDKPPRLKKIKRVVNKLDADIIVLIDTHRWIDIFDRYKLEEIFGYGSAFMVDLEDDYLKSIGHNNGIAALSNIQAIRYKKIQIATRNCLKIITDEFDIFGVYLDYQSEEKRKTQINHLLEYVNNERKTVIIGDFNAISKEDKASVVDEIDNLKERLPAFVKKHSTALSGMIGSEVVSILRSRGFMDMGAKKGNTLPTKFLTSEIKEPILRLDYAFISSNVEPEEFKVLRGELCDKTSDHYPIVIDVS